ncbi:C-mannosyltransferase dpy-19 homolog [Drosophila teissieri]|uniref:C-mannosyltransferase dpy-19 homolog n=1 Tax=Drosophila teissieri TaxID=7243 RepID=UPI001CB9FDF2|nr:C-mannosyltransferase dpy-19 homolog [Drosophila teissieri]
MREPNLYVILSHALIGSGFFFLYVQHVRVIFETRTNIQQLNQLEREALLRREDALYYAFYKQLADGPDFWHGYEQLKNVTDIEYPHSVNVLERFYVLPELVTAYFYHVVRSGFNPMVQPMQFYLEFVWLMGGVTLLVLYLYGTLLSENIFGGIYGVISYLMFHSFVAKIYERPLARENFAFPFIFLQMFYLCICIGRIIHRQRHTSRLFMVFAMSLFTACALLSWQFSAFIFTTQILIMMTSWNVSSLPTGLVNAFMLDYSLSHLLGHALAFVMSHGNSQLLFTFQLSISLFLFLITVVRQLRHVRSRRLGHAQDPLQGDYFSLKLIMLTLLLASTMQTTMLELLNRAGVVSVTVGAQRHFFDLCAHWALQVNIGFVAHLSACNPQYARVAWSELWQLVKTMIVKPYCMYGVVMLAMFFRRWRKSGAPVSAVTEEQRERARNYVLEDFLEEHRVSMGDMSNKETEKQLQKCFRLLKSCDHDYERYKRAQARLRKEQPPARDDFMQDIKRLRAQINRNSDKQRKERAQVTKEAGADEASTPTEEDRDPELEPKEENLEQGSTETEPESAADPTETLPSTSAADEEEEPSDTATAAGCSSNSSGQRRRKRSSSRRSSVVPTANAQILNMHYMYSFLQMVIFTFMGLAVRKLFFLSFTQGCVIAPTVCSKVWYHRQRNIFWSVSLAVFLLSMFDPGMVNIREEYFPTRYSKSGDDLDSMLEWIKLNTERDAVFAGPVDIIGTVHLTTKRPIVNHAHLEMRQMAERTEHVYSVYSRQQSSDIYNQCAQLKIQYLIISLDECTNEVRDDCDLLAIWDDEQPAYQKYPQFCHELLHKNVPSFLKVFANDHYGIIKMFSQSVQINLKHNKMPEMSI